MVGGFYSFMLSISPTAVTINTKVSDQSPEVAFTGRSNTLHINNQRNSSSPLHRTLQQTLPLLQLDQVNRSQGATVPGRMTDMPILFWVFHEILTCINEVYGHIISSSSSIIN